jgi:hypothetical protein
VGRTARDDRGAATITVFARYVRPGGGHGLLRRRRIGETIKSWSVMETVISVVGLIAVLLLSVVV